MSDTRFKFKTGQSEPATPPAPGVDPGYDHYCQTLAEFRRNAYQIMGEGLMPMPNPAALPKGAPKIVPIVAVRPIATKGDGGKFARLRQKVKARLTEAYRRSGVPEDFVVYTYHIQLSLSRYFEDIDYVHLRLVYASPINEEIAVLFDLGKNIQALKLLYKNRVLFMTNELPRIGEADSLNQLPLSVELGEDIGDHSATIKPPLYDEIDTQYGVYSGLPSYESLGTALDFEEAKQLAKKQWELHRN
jgi:hypothetical protein